MTIDQAEQTPMPFGKYKGQTLGAIADADVLYLDWLNGLDNLKPPLLMAVATICKAPRIRGFLGGGSLELAGQTPGTGASV
jgi:uncharacterized protein (DUF3820 family)